MPGVRPHWLVPYYQPLTWPLSYGTGLTNSGCLRRLFSVNTVIIPPYPHHDLKGMISCVHLIVHRFYWLMQFYRSLFSMLHPCNNGDHETPNVCWSAVEHAKTATGERPSLTRRLRVTTLPDPACQREQPPFLPNRGAPRMYGTNRAQHDSCVQS